MRAAKEFLDTEAYSRTGLIKQLVYDHYSEDDAPYAVDNITVNWNQQAAKAAKEFLHTEAYSHDGLVNQLMYDGFTASHAAYGVTAAGL